MTNVYENASLVGFKDEGIREILELEVGKKKELIKNFTQNLFDWNSKKENDIGIQCFCEHCKDEKTFIVKRNEFLNSAKKLIVKLDEINSNPNKTAKTKNDNIPVSKSLKNINKFEVELVCPICHEKMYFYYIYNDNVIEKICTYPDLMSGFKQKYSKYKKIKCSNNSFSYYDEMLEGCYAYYKIKSGIGSFCYFRRCLENYIKDSWEELKEQGLILNEYDYSLSFENKIKIIKPILDTEIYEILPNLYTILSKGIHELDEDECLNQFDTIREIVEYLLDEILAKNEKKSRIKLLKNEVSNKATELNQKK